MTKKTKPCLAVFALLFAASVSLMAVDISGEWELTIQSPRRERTQKVAFSQDGEDLTVIMEGMQGDEIEGQGTVEGDQIEWTITRSTPRGEFSMTFKGTIEGDTMSGEVSFGDRGPFEWTAEKVD
jgi:hypothetical protein